MDVIGSHPVLVSEVIDAVLAHGMDGDLLIKLGIVDALPLPDDFAVLDLLQIGEDHVGAVFIPGNVVNRALNVAVEDIVIQVDHQEIVTVQREALGHHVGSLKGDAPDLIEILVQDHALAGAVARQAVIVVGAGLVVIAVVDFAVHGVLLEIPECTGLLRTQEGLVLLPDHIALAVQHHQVAGHGKGQEEVARQISLAQHRDLSPLVNHGGNDQGLRPCAYRQHTHSQQHAQQMDQFFHGATSFSGFSKPADNRLFVNLNGQPIGIHHEEHRVSREGIVTQFLRRIALADQRLPRSLCVFHLECHMAQAVRLWEGHAERIACRNEQLQHHARLLHENDLILTLGTDVVFRYRKAQRFVKCQRLRAVRRQNRNVMQSLQHGCSSPQLAAKNARRLSSAFL